jgi:peptidylamidoglycolate lyase
MHQRRDKAGDDGGRGGVAGEDDKDFGRPTDIAWLKDGTFFVSDGYTNTRVVKFDKDDNS